MNHHHQPQTPYATDPTSPNTTFVQADPSTFRSIVQQLTGAPDYHQHHHSSSPKKLSRPTAATTTVATPELKRSAFKLQERRQTTKNLHINLHSTANHHHEQTQNHHHHHHNQFRLRQQKPSGILVSPVSTLDLTLMSSPSPRSPGEEIEEKVVAEKGFHLHPLIVSPLATTPRGHGADPPELLPLFPLKSLRDSDHDHA